MSRLRGRAVALVAALVVPLVASAGASAGAVADAAAGADRPAAAEPTATAEAEELAAFSDPEILESSGLVVVDGRWVTVNDSGDSGRVLTVDPATGDTVGVTSWEPDPFDVEAVAPVVEDGVQTGDVWVADIGDNAAVRDSVSLVRVPVGEGDRSVQPEVVELVYPDGPRDAESLLTDPVTGRLYVVSKGLLGGEFFAVPEELSQDGPTTMEPVAPAAGIATDGSFFPDGRHVVVRNYGSAYVYTFPDLLEIGSVTLPAQPQGEGVAVDPADPTSLLLTSEGSEQPVLRVPLPDELAAAVAPEGGDDPAESAESADQQGSDEEPALPSWLFWVGGGAAVVLLVVAAGAAVAVVRRPRERR